MRPPPPVLPSSHLPSPSALCLCSPSLLSYATDATVVRVCKDYGRQRCWASGSWGVLSIAAGALIHWQGIRAGIFMYGCLSGPAVVAALVF